MKIIKNSKNCCDYLYIIKNKLEYRVWTLQNEINGKNKVNDQIIVAHCGSIFFSVIESGLIWVGTQYQIAGSEVLGVETSK